ncbi:NAD(P)/FAD-dependent oxidoreductase [Hymenobacter yonginensis]|uniref:NAD(P)/FAD-dependent oxidoreductase n=1 Tax=Hymenobacter yonginensis TaxID=748197 RepID=A0ABY7PV57_9BACT|nr:NAD(P)/FAD-dependent oxidoreductase [Hymenobacter yonginensis]WBO86796.1 NAD(P)/FAD-dependent oxidoreductase [Hymenobacter yonginensis]
MNFDTIIVGAGNAGLSAALTLGRSRRRGLVLDGGPPRNVPAAHAHNFFTRDGTPPAELLRLGREQLQPYDGVEIRAALAQTARAVPGGFALELVEGTAVTARTLLLAPGVVDVLLAIPGFRELWGRGVYHSPYCHGREVRDQPLALYGRGALGFHLAVLLHHWAPGPVLCTDGPAELDAAQLATLGQLGIRVLETPVAALEPAPAGGLTVAFADESRLAVAAVFARVPQQQRTDLAAQLGCAFTDDGIYIQTTWYGPDQRARRVRRRRPDQPVPAGGSRGRGRHGRGGPAQ